jgi:hypothetical protein
MDSASRSDYGRRGHEELRQPHNMAGPDVRVMSASRSGHRPSAVKPVTAGLRGVARIRAWAERQGE